MSLVSVITPLYNSSAFIAETIESVKNQTYADWEMIIVNDQSTDNSLDIASTYAQYDTRIKIIQLPENSGPAVARNKGINAARGRYIAFLDSDDRWLPEKLEIQIAFMRSSNAAFTHTYYRKITEDGTPTGHTVTPKAQLSYSDLLKSNQIGCLTAVYDTCALGKCFMPSIRKRQDYGLWLRLLKITPFAHVVPQVLATYRVRNQSVSSYKMGLLKYNWTLFRNIEKLSRTKSTYYLAWNIARKLTQ